MPTVKIELLPPFPKDNSQPSLAKDCSVASALPLHALQVVMVILKPRRQVHWLLFKHQAFAAAAFVTGGEAYRSHD